MTGWLFPAELADGHSGTRLGWETAVAKLQLCSCNRNLFLVIKLLSSNPLNSRVSMSFRCAPLPRTVGLFIYICIISDVCRKNWKRSMILVLLVGSLFSLFHDFGDPRPIRPSDCLTGSIMASSTSEDVAECAEDHVSLYMVCPGNCGEGGPSMIYISLGASDRRCRRAVDLTARSSVMSKSLWLASAIGDKNLRFRTGPWSSSASDA